jgi:hypothetical protein
VLAEAFREHGQRAAGIARLGGLVHAVEHDRGAFLEVDRPPMSFDLASLDLHGAGFGATCRYQVGHAERA